MGGERISAARSPRRSSRSGAPPTRFGAVRLTASRAGRVRASAPRSPGVAGTEEVLIAGRMVQGLGASVLTATGLSLVSTQPRPADRGGSSGSGPGVGRGRLGRGTAARGWLEALGSWRLFFLVDVPFALVVLWFLRAARDGDAPAAAVDVLGGRVALTLGLGRRGVRAARRPRRRLGLGGRRGAGRRARPWLLLADVRGPGRARAAAPLLDRRLFGGYRYRAVAIGRVRRQRRVRRRRVLRVAVPPAGAGPDPVAAGAVFLAMTVPLIVLSPGSGAGRSASPVGRSDGRRSGRGGGVGGGVRRAAGSDDGLGPVIVAPGALRAPGRRSSSTSRTSPRSTRPWVRPDSSRG